MAEPQSPRQPQDLATGSPAPIRGGGAGGKGARAGDGPVLVGSANFSIIRRNCPAQLVLAGEFDIGSVCDLTAAVSDAAGSTGVLHIDLAGVGFCDLAALRIIVGPAQASARQQGPARPVVLHHPSAEVERILRLTGWDALPGLTLDYGKASSDTP